MQNLQIKIDELESNIIERDIYKINKTKLKPISYKSTKDRDEEKIKKYNYYIKLNKKIKKYLRDYEYSTISIKHDRYSNIVCLVSRFNSRDMEISMPIDIRIIVGDLKDTYMKCSYYNQREYGLLYINEFMSGKPGYGYGSLLLSNLKDIIRSINSKLNEFNRKNDVQFREIKVVSGKSLSFNGVISQKNLNKLYIKYGFEIDSKNNINMIIE